MSGYIKKRHFYDDDDYVWNDSKTFILYPKNRRVDRGLSVRRWAEPMQSRMDMCHLLTSIGQRFRTIESWKQFSCASSEERSRDLNDVLAAGQGATAQEATAQEAGFADLQP